MQLLVIVKWLTQRYLELNLARRKEAGWEKITNNYLLRIKYYTERYEDPRQSASATFL
jgi:hypothetical protein